MTVVNLDKSVPPIGRRLIARPRKLTEKGIAATDIAKMLGVSRATYRYLTEDGAA